MGDKRMRKYSRKQIEEKQQDRSWSKKRSLGKREWQKEKRLQRELQFNIFGLTLPDRVCEQLSEFISAGQGLLCRFSSDIDTLSGIKRLVMCFVNIYMAKSEMKLVSVLLNLADLITTFGMSNGFRDKVMRCLNLVRESAGQMSPTRILETLFKDALLGVMFGSLYYLIGGLNKTSPALSDRELHANVKDMLKDSTILSSLNVMGQIGRDARGIEMLTESMIKVFNAILDKVLLLVYGFNPNVGGLEKYLVGYEEWYQRVERIAYRRDMSVTELDVMKTDVRIAIKAEALYKAGRNFSKQLAELKVGVGLVRFHDMIMKDLKELVTKVENSGVFSQKPRSEPVVILLYGAPGAGKTIASRFVCKGLCNLAGLGESWKNQVYYRNVEQEFWDGYNGQFITAVDDYMQKIDTAAVPNPEIFELIRMNNSAPYNLHMAQVHDKGNSVFTSRAVVYSSNSVHFDIKSITDKNAFYRRFDFVVEVKPKQEFMQDKFNDRMDRNKVRAKFGVEYHPDVYEMEVFEARSIEVGRNTGELRFEKTGEVISFGEFFNRVGHVFDDRNQDMNKLIDVLDECEIGMRDLHMWPFSNWGPRPISRSSFEWARVMRAARLYHRSQRLCESEHAVMCGMIFTGSSVDYLEDLRVKFPDEEKFIAEIDEDQIAFQCEIVESPVTTWFKKIQANEVAWKVFNIVIEVLRGVVLCVMIKVIATWIYKWLWPEDGCVAPMPSVEATQALEQVERNLESKSRDERITIRRVVETEKELESKSRDERIIIRRVVENDPTATTAPLYKRLVESHKTNQKGKSVCINCHNDCEEKLCGDCSKFADCDFTLSRSMQNSDHKDLLSDKIVYKHYHVCEVKGCQQRYYHFHSRGKNSSHAHFCVYHSSEASKLDMSKELHGWSDEVAQLLISERITANLYSLGLTNNSDGVGEIKASTQGLFIKGRTLLTVRHWWEYAHMKDYKFVVLENLFGRRFVVRLDKLIRYEFLNDDGEVDKEAILVSIPHTVHTHPDITKHFVTSHELSAFGKTHAIIPTLRNVRGKKVCMLLGGEMQITANDGVDTFKADLDGRQYSCVARKYYEYSAPTTFGDCGSPVVINNPKLERKLCGIHYSGYTALEKGFAQSITFGDLTKVLEKIPKELHLDLDVDYFTTFMRVDPTIDGNSVFYESANYREHLPCDMIPIGKGHRFTTATRTQLKKSKLYGKLGVPVTKKPALLRPTGDLDPLKIGLKKVTRIPGYVDIDVIKTAANDFKKGILRNIEPRYCRVLSLEESVRGVPGDHALPPVNRRSSPGYPWALNKNAVGKTQWLGKDDYKLEPELSDAVTERIENARKGKRSPSVFIDSLKDELRAEAKVDLGKTRVFCNGPQDMTLAFRQYFLGFNAHVMKNRIHNEIAVGIRNRTQEWDMLAKHLGVDANLLAGDFIEYDGSLITDILRESVNIVNEYYNDGNELVRQVLAEDIYHSIHITPDGHIYMWDHSNTSGNSMTSIINSMFNSIAMRVVWIMCGFKIEDFKRHVRMISYGDDNGAGVSKEVSNDFNMRTVSEAFAKFGMQYTMEDKGSISDEVRTLSQISFLKRGFKYNEELQRWEDPLDLQTIVESLYWIRNSPDEEQEIKENLEQTVRELALHGCEVYEKFITIICKEFRKAYGSLVFVPSYKSVRNSMLDEEGLERELHCVPDEFVGYSDVVDLGREQFRFDEALILTPAVEAAMEGVANMVNFGFAPWRFRWLQYIIENPSVDGVNSLNHFRIRYCPCMHADDFNDCMYGYWDLIEGVVTFVSEDPDDEVPELIPNWSDSGYSSGSESDDESDFYESTDDESW